MTGAKHARTIAAYKNWLNDSLHRAVKTLDESAIKVERGAFFGSIYGTLIQILWSDRMWISRFARSAKPNQPHFAGSVKERRNWPDLKTARAEMDQAFINWAADLDNARLAEDPS